MSLVNKQILLVGYTDNKPKQEHFKCVEKPVEDVPEGKILIKVLYISVDPFSRALMTDHPKDKQVVHESVPLNTPMKGLAIGQVIISKNKSWNKGVLVHGSFGWQSYEISDGTMIYPIDDTHIPASAYLGVLGLTGFTAWGGMTLVGKPEKGKTVLVSSGAGATGSVAGQIAKIKGCRVVGIAGSDEKVKWMVEEAGFDAGINYKVGNLADSIKREVPEGVDLYFDNVGGEMLETVLDHMNLFGTIVGCGFISQYNTPKQGRYGIKNIQLLIEKELEYKGFVIRRFYKDHLMTFLQQGANWLKEGKLKYKENILEGIESAPKALESIFTGSKIGKMIIRVGDKE